MRFAVLLALCLALILPVAGCGKDKKKKRKRNRKTPAEKFCDNAEDLVKGTKDEAKLGDCENDLVVQLEKNCDNADAVFECGADAEAIEAFAQCFKKCKEK